MDHFSFVVKIASRCNLNCSYCYMYNMGDTTYRSQPKVMAFETVEKLANRLKSFCTNNNIKSISIILHGGEPLLAGKDFFSFFVKSLNIILTDLIQVNYFVQTNGVLIDEGWMMLFQKLKINLGISLDGDKKTNDKYRLDHKGNGSYDRVINKYRLAIKSQYRLKAPAVLSVINIDSDPVSQYQHHKKAGIRSFDLLLPDSNWDKLPPSPSESSRYSNSATGYADWLIELFDEWFDDVDSINKPKIRKFNQIITMILGGDISSDDLGSGANNILVIETDGSYETADSLKICGEGFTKAGSNVLNDEIEEGLSTELAKYYFHSHSKLHSECLSCRIKDICGGGYLPHRYSLKNGFDNPSVFCLDLTKLICHIQNRLLAILPEELKVNSKVKKYSFQEVVELRSNKSLFEN